jgi:hypothetical protein
MRAAIIVACNPISYGEQLKLFIVPTAIVVESGCMFQLHLIFYFALQELCLFLLWGEKHHLN